MTNSTSKLLLNSRLLAILCLGFASGLPLMLTNTTLQAWFTEAHVNLMAIGALSLVGIPYTFKFLWAPLMDHIGFPGLGKRIGWILLAQLGLALALFGLANMQPSSQAVKMGFVALVVAFFSASQDISITAYQTDLLLPEERGLGAAYYVFAYRIATLITGGLALIFADYLGWKLTYDLMGILVIFCMLTTYLSPRAHEPVLESTSLWQTSYAAMKNLFQRDKMFLILAFIVLYKVGDALALQLMTNFLLKGLGFSLTEVGVIYKTVSIVGTISGVFVGGILLTRLNIYWALLMFGLAQAFSNLMFVVLALAGKSFLVMGVSVCIENFCSGMSTAALLAFMMSLCDHHYTASQYAVLSAVASLGRVFLGPIASLLVENLGWVEFYCIAFVLSFPSLVILMYLKPRVLSHAQLAANT